jgi:hypothetical protein
MKCDGTAKRLYLALTILLIEHEIAKFRQGEERALVSFTKVAKLARNATKELTAPRKRERAWRPDACRRTGLH